MIYCVFTRALSLFHDKERLIVKGYLRLLNKYPRKYCAKNITNDIINYFKSFENIKRKKSVI